MSAAYAKMTNAQLQALLKAQGRTGFSKMNKAQLVDALLSKPVQIPTAVKTGNEKRKESCKMVGGEKKRNGHSVEGMFQHQFGKGDVDVTYKAESDSVMDVSNVNTHALNSRLIETFGVGADTAPNVSNKSGRNLQFVLGRIPEIESAKTTDEKIAAVSAPALWQKYLKKSTSAKPANWLVYLDKSTKQWIFFNMDDVVDYVVTKCVWRILSSGRMKGDFEGTQYLTYEYRTTHKSHFLGANGNKGDKWIALLTKNLRHLKADLLEEEGK